MHIKFLGILSVGLFVSAGQAQSVESDECAGGPSSSCKDYAVPNINNSPPGHNLINSGISQTPDQQTQFIYGSGSAVTSISESCETASGANHSFNKSFNVLLNEIILASFENGVGSAAAYTTHNPASDSIAVSASQIEQCEIGGLDINLDRTYAKTSGDPVVDCTQDGDLEDCNWIVGIDAWSAVADDIAAGGPNYFAIARLYSAGIVLMDIPEENCETIYSSSWTEGTVSSNLGVSVKSVFPAQIQGGDDDLGAFVSTPTFFQWDNSNPPDLEEIGNQIWFQIIDVTDQNISCGDMDYRFIRIAPHV